MKVRKTDSIVCAQIVQLIPGVLLHQTSAVQYPYGWASLIALVAGQCLFNPKIKPLHVLVVSFLLTSVSIMIYQPSGALILFIPIAKYILERNQANSRNLTRAIIIFTFALSLNYLLARLFYSSPRLENDLQFATKVEEFIKFVIPSSLLLFDGIYTLNSAFKLLIYLIVILILIFHLRSIRRFKLEGVSHKINDVLIASLFFPLTLGWLIFVSEVGISQRKIMWGSLISITILYLILSIRQEKVFNQLKKMLILVIVVSSIAWPLEVRLNHVDLQIKEWGAAQCASKKSIVSDDQEIGPFYSNLIYSQKKSEYQDEYAVLSSRFPGPRIFIPFLANNAAARPNKIESAWTLKLSEDTDSVYASWGTEFIACFNSNQ
jgi:hypothetical protein